MVALFEILLLLPFLSVCLAQTQPKQTFKWGFVDQSLASNLNVEQCQTVILKTIVLANGTDNSVPPYSIASFEVSGIPDWQYNISTDRTNIPWTVRHNAGAQLLVTVVDSQGNDAGFPQMISVLASSNTTCLLPASSNLPVISNVNVTGGDSLSTCGLWGMSVTGGTPPYGAFIVASGNPAFTPFNASIRDTNRLTYKNRAFPNNQMIVAIQDSKGVWAVSTQAIKTKGKTDMSCVDGVESSWILDSVFQKQMNDQAAAAARAHKKLQVTIALAVVFSLLGATIIGLGFWYWSRYRRPAKLAASSLDLPPPPPPYDPEKGVDVSIGGSSSITTFNTRISRDGSAISGPIDLGRAASDASDFGRRARVASEIRSAAHPIPDTSSPSSGSDSPPRRANSTSPFPPGRQPSRKALQAAEERRLARERVPPAPALTSDGVDLYANPAGYSVAGPSRQLTVASNHSTLNRQPSNESLWQDGAAGEDNEYGVDADDLGTIVIQHRDAGASQLVVELPPAYVPRGDDESPIGRSDTKSPYEGPSDVRVL